MRSSRGAGRLCDDNPPAIENCSNHALNACPVLDVIIASRDKAIKFGEHEMQQQDPIVIPMEDGIIHTKDSPFCSVDPACPCHEDSELLSDVARAVEQGLLTPDEATRVVMGKTV